MGEPVELELDLSSDGQDGYRVTVRSTAGEESGRLLLDPDPLIDRRGQLQTTVLASAVTSRSALSEVEAPLREVGETLFRALFDDDVYAAYKASLALAAERGTQLRVVLRTQAAELAALPWEMMYDPGTGAYLCRREPMVRHIMAPGVTPPLTVTPPLRILGVVASPRDRAELDVAGERRRLDAALDPLGSGVSLSWVDGGRWVDVMAQLVAGDWHVLHFVGHGGFHGRRKEGVLILEKDNGDSDLVGAERFSDLLASQERPLQLVVLNSCAGALSAADDVFSSSAATLIRSGVPAVVAMQFAVSDPAAKAFAAGFYQAVARNRSVADAVRIGRIGIRGLSEETLEWVTPVLYLRGKDAPMFDVLPPPDRGPEQPPVPSPEQAAGEAAARALYERAVAQADAGELADAVALFDILLANRADYGDAVDRRARAAEKLRPPPPPAPPPPPPAHRWRYVVAAAAVLVLALGVVWAWPDDGPNGSDGSVPDPFESAALWEMARNHFEPGDCEVVEREEQAPLGWKLPHTELLKCLRPDYNGTLLCTSDGADLDTVREAYLAKALDDPQPVTQAPAGRDQPWPFQVSFHHEPAGAGRVYWDDADSLCAAEIQVAETDAQVAVEHFVTGLDS